MNTPAADTRHEYRNMIFLPNFHPQPHIAPPLYRPMDFKCKENFTKLSKLKKSQPAAQQHVASHPMHSVLYSSHESVSPITQNMEYAENRQLQDDKLATDRDKISLYKTNRGSGI